jgi:hypothetical protein
MTAGYCLLVIISLQHPTSAPARVAAALDAWLKPVMTPIFDAIGWPACGARKAAVQRIYGAYVQLVVVDLVIATAWFLACIPFWPAWAKRLRERPRWVGAAPAKLESDFELGQGLALVGAFGAACFLVVGYQPTSAGTCAVLNPWSFLRVPLIVTVIYGFSCFSAAFALARPPEGEDPLRH